MSSSDVSEIIDRLEIAELVNRYALHIDLWDIEAWVDLFTEDAFFDEREFGSGLHEGHAAIRAYGELLDESVEHAVHLMSNLVIGKLTPTSASGTVFALVEAEMKTGLRQRFHVRYEDDYVKIAGKWKINRRTLRKSLPPEDITTLANPTNQLERQ